MGKKSNKQRSSYTPNNIFMSDGTSGLTDEERQRAKDAAAERERRRLELAQRSKLNERDYNKSLFEVDPIVGDILLPNNHVMVRLLLKPPTGSGLYLAKSASKLDLQDPDHVKFEIDQSHAAQALHRGVVVAIGEGCSEMYKKHLTVGAIVDLQMAVNPNNYMVLIDKEEVEFDNYYSFPEQYIHFIWKTDPKGYRLGSIPSPQGDSPESPTSLIESV